MGNLAFWLLLCAFSSASKVIRTDPLNIDVRCDSAGIYVHVSFQKPFEGIIYSKGNLNDPQCRYYTPQQLTSNFSFLIPHSRCGTETFQFGSSLIQRNTVVFQSNPLLQTSMDYISRLSCGSSPLTEHVTPYVTVPSSGTSKNPKTWMEIKRRGDPLSHSGTAEDLKVGDEVMAVIYISNPRNMRSIRIVDCEAREHANINSTVVKLLDNSGCPLQPQIFSIFKFLPKNSGNFTVAFSNMTAFRFSEKTSLFITCGIEVCQSYCQACPQSSKQYSPVQKKRSKKLLTRSDLSSTHHSAGKVDKRKMPLSESTARLVMKETIAALSLGLKPSRSHRRLDSKADNSPVLSRRYIVLEHGTEEPKFTDTRISTKSDQSSKSNLHSAEHQTPKQEINDTRLPNLYKADPLNAVSSSAKLVKHRNSSLTNSIIVPNKTVTRALSVLPSDVVVDIDTNYTNELQSYCTSSVKFTVVTACLSLFILCLLMACIMLTMNIRRINRTNSISRFLLYPYN